jgi:ABC-type phosphate/phosphonate transport system substrate-binding protein|tara:strand:+ start:5939 stop:6478 length:540 start_codon:yes stop_codon:yes gene_type:complete
MLQKKIITLSLFLSGIFLITSCTTIPPLDFTIPNVYISDNRQDAELKSLTVGFAPKEQQTVVQQTNATLPPIWKEALEDAINRSLIFTDDASKKVNISARIFEVNPPEIGLAMTTWVGALYEVIDRSNGEVLVSEKIRTSGTVELSFAFEGMIRARESVNRAVRANIQEFISVLEKSAL